MNSANITDKDLYYFQQKLKEELRWPLLPDQKQNRQQDLELVKFLLKKPRPLLQNLQQQQQKKIQNLLWRIRNQKS